MGQSLGLNINTEDSSSIENIKVANHDYPSENVENIAPAENVFAGNILEKESKPA